MRRILYGLGTILLVVGVIYGEFGAIRAFFDVQTCSSNGPAAPPDCQWLLAGWSPLVLVVLFLVYLPFSVIVSLYFGAFFYIPGAVLLWVGKPAAGKS